MGLFFRASTDAQRTFGYSDLVEVTPTLDTNAYQTADHLGSLMTFQFTKVVTGSKVFIQSLTVTDAASQRAEIDFLFFNALPTIASSDNAAFNVSDAELAAKGAGVVTVYSADYRAFNANSIASVQNVGLIVPLAASSDSLYVSMIVRGAPTYAVDSLKIKLGVTADANP